MTSARPLAGKRVIVTGAAQGLGREFTLHLAGLGAQVLAADIDPEPLLLTSELAGGQGTPIRTHLTDVSDERQTQALAGAARDSMGGLDALVNNAAVAAGLTRRPFEEIPSGEWDRVLTVNLKGAWLCAKAAVPLLRDAGRGSIVNLASEVAFSGSPGLAHYDASKAALIGLTRTLARELGPDQIRVNALAPGFIPTEATGISGSAYDTSATPLGRVGQPADLLGALVLLLSDDSAFITGQTLLVNGGRLLH
jgi:NAD(P)-dependent dehydrogenase (short-subunit alcohol dehydrogenase family)